MTSANIVFGDRFASVVPLINIANTGGVAAGPPLGGFLYELFGYSGPFFLKEAVSCSTGPSSRLVWDSSLRL